MNRYFLFFLFITLCCTAMARTEIAAHRGFHQKYGATRNSMEAIRMAQEVKFEWIEIDINLSSDGELMVIHGPWHPNKQTGIEVSKSTKRELRNILLTNGELVPTFEEVLTEVKQYERLGLILDMKTRNTAEEQREFVKKVATLVSKHKMQDRVLYMVNIEQSVYQLRRLNKRADNILFSNGSYSPQWRANMGCKYIGYGHLFWTKKPEFMADCSRLGLKTIAWTPNNEADIKRVVEMGIDIIISDKPMLVRKVINELNK